MNKTEIDFEQKRFLKRKRFKIKDNGVECNDILIIEESSYLIPFEEIMDNPVKWTVFSKMWLFLMTGSVILESYIFFDYLFLQKDFHASLSKWTGVFSIICIVNFFATYNKLVYYSLGKRFQIAFFSSRQENERINNFMQLVFKARNTFLEQKNNLEIPQDLHRGETFSISEEIYRLNKLLEQGIISDSEFADAKKIIIRNDKSSERKIGF